MIKLVIFDWSGTISNDFLKTYEVVMQVFMQYGKEPISISKFRQDFDIPQETFYRKNGFQERWEELDSAFKRLWKKHPVRIPDLCPNTKKILVKLKKNKQIAIVSSHHSVFLREEIKYHKLEKFFDYIEGSTQEKCNSIKFIVNSLKLTPRQVIFVGDMKYDIQHGKKAGVKTGAIGTGYQSKKTLLTENPDYYFNNLTDLYKRLNNS